MAITVRTFLKDGTEVTGQTVIVPPEIVFRIKQIRDETMKGGDLNETKRTFEHPQESNTAGTISEKR